MKSLKPIFTNMLLYQTYGLLYLPGVFSWGWQHRLAAILMLAVKVTVNCNCTTWKKEENNLFFMLMVFIILNLIRGRKLENRLPILKKESRSTGIGCWESCEPFINGYLLEGSKVIRICLNRAEPALTHEDGLANAVKPHPMILQALLWRKYR